MILIMTNRDATNRFDTHRRETRRHYTANLMKGGAMIPETLALLRDWSPETPLAIFTETVIRENRIGKATRARVGDVLRRVFVRRFLQGSAPVAPHLRALAEAGYPEPVLRSLLYYHTALTEDLLYDFVVGPLFELYQSGRGQVGTADVVEFVDELTAAGAIAPPWSENTKRKTARGLLAALRDFGLLEGKAKKRLRSLYLPMPAFLYVAHHLRDQGALGIRLLQHPAWRLFLYGEPDVEKRFLEAHQEGYLGYYAAGGIVRVEWRYPDLGGLVRALAGSAHPAP